MADQVLAQGLCGPKDIPWPGTKYLTHETFRHLANVSPAWSSTLVAMGSPEGDGRYDGWKYTRLGAST